MAPTIPQYLKPDGTFKWTRMSHPLTGSLLFCTTKHQTYSIIKAPKGYRLRAYPSKYVMGFKTQREAKNAAVRHFINNGGLKQLYDELIEGDA